MSLALLVPSLLAASTESTGRIFLDILIVLVAAKVAAELAERVNIPAVVGEITAGILIGPSALGWVSVSEVLTILGELGVILLLLEVGMQMDLRELKAVGRSSMTVAVIGVTVPFAAGFAVAELFDLSTNQALFLSAALTATSVGITARVFGDLRALATGEARTVLGAAVADDVIGLVILTVVVRIVTGSGSVTALSVLSILAVAVAFLVVCTGVGTVLAPRLFAAIDRHSRSSGTLFALGLAFTLGIAQLATLAKLAPIVGAFVAGLALGRSESSGRIQRELTPVGHLFIPVFFLEIGINTDVKQYAKPAVLGLAAALIAVAIVGKVVAGIGAWGTPTNKLLIGLGMIPRGEVGLIFASIGLREGILTGNLYAAILMMVLVTTLITPPLLSFQYARVRRGRAAHVGAVAERPPGGWLAVEEHDTVDLVARPPDDMVLPLALEAAVLMARHTPGPALLDWLIPLSDPSSAPSVLVWTPQSVALLQEVLETGNDRSWRFLETTTVLERSMPELAETLRRRRLDPVLLDPGGVHRWPLLDAMRRVNHGEIFERDALVSSSFASLERPQRLLLAALLVDATTDDPTPLITTRSLLNRLHLSDDDDDAIGQLIAEQQLLRAASVRPDGLTSESVMRIATHLGTRERVTALYVLSVVLGSLDDWERRLLDQLHQSVMAGLSVSNAAGISGSYLDRKRADAIALLPPRSAAAQRITVAPVQYLLNEEPADIARQVALIQPIPTKGRFRVEVQSDGTAGAWRIEIGGRDQVGLLALTTDVLERARLDVVDAVIATWGDGGALQAFRVTTDPDLPTPDPASLQSALTEATMHELVAPPVSDASISFDDAASPWHTIAEVRATDRRGLLHSLAVACAAGGANVHAARVTTEDEMALDRFDLTDRLGRKLDEDTKADIRRALINGVEARGATRRLPWNTNRVGTIRKHSGSGTETAHP